MRIRLINLLRTPIFIWCGSDFSLWCGSGSEFLYDADPDPQHCFNDPLARYLAHHVPWLCHGIPDCPCWGTARCPLSPPGFRSSKSFSLSESLPYFRLPRSEIYEERKNRTQSGCFKMYIYSLAQENRIAREEQWLIMQRLFFRLFGGGLNVLSLQTLESALQ